MTVETTFDVGFIFLHFVCMSMWAVFHVSCTSVVSCMCQAGSFFVVDGCGVAWHSNPVDDILVFGKLVVFVEMQ